MDNYRIEVLQLFEEKKTAGLLSMNLANPRPSKLRDECVILFSSNKCTKADVYMLKTFFQIPLDQDLRASTVKKFDIDKFKPLISFLKLGLNTRDKNIELLAWLIDFKLRPYSRYVDEVNKRDKNLSGLKVSLAGNIIDNSIKMEAAAEEFYESARNEVLIDKGRHIMPPTNTYSESSSSEVVCLSKQVTLEYPSGVKINIDADDLDLISRLVKL